MIRIFYKRTVLVLAAIIIGSMAMAQITEAGLDSVLKGSAGKLVAGAQAYVTDTVFFDAALKPSILNTNKVSNIVTFRIDELSNPQRLLPDSFKVDANIRVIYTNSNNLVDSVNKTLSITYYKTGAYTSRAWFYFSDAYRVNVKVLSLSAQYAVLDSVVRYLELENEILLDRDYKLDCSQHSIHTISKDASRIDTTGELAVSWPIVPVAEEYDLEWTYIDKSAIQSGRYNVSGQLNADLLFKFNATRVTVSGTQYNIPLLYDGDGLLYFRVRAAQTHNDGRRVTTPWSSDFVNDGGLGSYDFVGHERKLNWQANTSFAEEGKRKSVVQYFDGSLKGRQTVTKDNTTQTTVVAETFYDHQGRPAIQVMPAPTLNTLIKYTPRFNTINGAEYDKGVYDTAQSAADYCGTGAPKMDSTTGVSQYYSPANPQAGSGYHQYIPNANGYAFTETKYEADNTGRISAQSGVGKDYRLGLNRETIYYYGEPDQEELDALFGTEAGDYSHYQKNMVRDANGQYSVSYVDMHGRTVATALAGDAPASMQALPSNTSSTITTSLINSTNNLIKGTAIESVKGLIVTKAGNHIFNYQLNPESLGLANCNNQTICYDCLYDLEITVTDDCNNQHMPGDTAHRIVRKNFSLGSIDTTCTAAQGFSINDTLLLQEGSYTVTKRLTINEEAMKYYRDSVYLVQNTCKSYDDIVNEQRTIIQQQLGDCTPDTLNEYDYQSYRQQMLDDVTPSSGQYANPETADSGYSIFNKKSNVYLYQEVANYKDGDGNDAVVIIDGQSKKPQELKNEEDFISNFEDSWANALLPLHPEYPLLVDYEKLSASHIWDEDFLKTDTYTEALAKGYLNPTGNASQPAVKFSTTPVDPLFTSLSGQFSAADSIAAKQSLNDSLFTFRSGTYGGNTKVYNLWALVTVIVKCGSGTAAVDQSCADTWSTNANVFGTGLCEGELNMAWRIFRSQYQKLKQEWISNFIRSRNPVATPVLPYVAVFPKSSDIFKQSMGIDNVFNPDTAYYNQKAKAQLDDEIDSSCHQYAQRWVLQLGTCNYPPDSLNNVIIPRLVQVCKEGGDASHPFGASSVKPASTYPYKTFEDVIKDYNQTHGITTNASCNAFLIDMPKPYGTSTFITNQFTYQKPDSCTCGRISQLHAGYAADSTSYTSFSNYMLVKYKTTVTQGTLDSLLSLCNGTITCHYIRQMITIPPALQCGAEATCATCNNVKQLYDSFTVKFPGSVPSIADTTAAQDTVNRLFENYMKQKLGFSKSAAEYLTFMDSCTMDHSSDCDSLLAIKNDYRKISTDVKKGTAAYGIKLTPVKDQIIEMMNGLLGSITNGPADTTSDARYKIVTPINFSPANKLFTISNYVNPYATSVDTFTVYSGVVPVNIQYINVVDAATATMLQHMADTLTVSAGDFAGSTTPDDFTKKYYGGSMWGRKYQTGFNMLWGARRAWTGVCGPALGSYYGVAGPMTKYLVDTCYEINCDYYSFTFIKRLTSLTSYSQYTSYAASPGSTNIYKNSDIRRVLSFTLDTTLLRLNHDGSNVADDHRTGTFINVKLVLANYDTTDAWVNISYCTDISLNFKESADTTVYGLDCQKGFTAYYNSRKGTSYTYTQIDSIYFTACGNHLNVCDDPVSGLTCQDLKKFETDYYNQYVNPSGRVVDMPMRTLAGNYTPAEGPKGVFDVNGKLIGNTVDSTFGAVNASFAQIWNSSPVDSVIGTLSALPDGRFRLSLKPGQQAPCAGITGMRYYQFDVTDTILNEAITGTGCYVDFGDGKGAKVNDLLNTDSTRTTRDMGYYGYAYPYTHDYSGFYSYNTYHRYTSQATRTVTVYHSEIKGVAAFDCPSCTVLHESNLRGYFPQQLLSVYYHVSNDSTLVTFSKIKNFSQINTLELLFFEPHFNTYFPGNLRIQSLAHNHNLRLINVTQDASVLPSAIRPFDGWLPDMNINFPKLSVISFSPFDTTYGGRLNFSIPGLSSLYLNSASANHKVSTAFIDRTIQQVAAGSTQRNGFLQIYPTNGAVRSAASNVAVDTLIARGWFLNGAGMSNAGTPATFQAPPAYADSIPWYTAFTDFVNTSLGTNLTQDSLVKIYLTKCGYKPNLCSIQPALNTASLLCDNQAMDYAINLYQPDACSDSTQLITETATEIYKAYKDSLIGAFNEAYTAKCLNAGTIESFTLTKPVSEYHYTLYYYDQAGNLIKTISPEGVHPNRDNTWLAQVKTKRASGDRQVPVHTLPVVYRYNSLNQVITQFSPDGGYSRFWYDRLGRLAVSQNAKQLTVNNYSYTRYDSLGRITEVGEKYQPTVMAQTISRDQAALLNWLNYSYTQNSQTILAQQVTRTVYDLVASLPLVSGTTAYNFHQKGYTMRNRVSNTLFYDVLPVSGGNAQYSEYSSGTYYSYDIHGNVDTLLHDYRLGLMAGNGANRFKLTAYNYDLISGKVNQVHYQPGEKDQFYHRYEYDAENRITDVFTTNIKEFVGTRSNEDHEAFYQYYKHGPLARTVLGQQQVQGIDYAYTLQGWLKGVNSTSLRPDIDMGADAGTLTARDAYGFNLNYFTGEYSPINVAKTPFPGHTGFMPGGEYKELYNGNISSMAVNISKFAPQLYNYHYDQLNRIVSMDVYRGLSQVNNSWVPQSPLTTLPKLDIYHEAVSYDANGNILGYKRNGTTEGGLPLAMDSLTYKYFKDVNGNIRNNRLRMVRDAVASANYTEDIDDQLSAVNNTEDSNYVYDEIGNLIRDKAEKIDSIKWNVYGKITTIYKTATTQNPVTKITYTYDAAGNRISKKVEKGATSETTWYVRDAQGNVLGVYTDKNALTLTEHHVYGSSRLGIANRDLTVADPSVAETSLNLLGNSYTTNFDRGKKFFELTNHLGNVLVTVSDRKLQVTSSSQGGQDNGGCEIGSGKDTLNVPVRNGEVSYEAKKVVNVLPGFTSANGDDYVIAIDSSLTACVPYTDPALPTQGWYYTAEIVGTNDYYPFGSLMPGRKFTSGSYRYGFNGKENDNDVKGEGNQQDYGMRIYDSRIGRFLSIDPLQVKYPELTPYQFASNIPSAAIDLDGLESVMHYYVTNIKDNGSIVVLTNITSNGKPGYSAEFSYHGRQFTSATYSDKAQVQSLVNYTSRAISNAWDYRSDGEKVFYKNVNTLEGVIAEDDENTREIINDQERFANAALATMAFASTVVESAPIDRSSMTGNFTYSPTRAIENQVYRINNGNPGAVITNTADETAIGAQQVKGVTTLKGSGPVSGVLEVSSDVKSTKAFNNYKPSKPIEFVFDPTTKKFLVGQPNQKISGLSGHQQLVKVGNLNSGTTVGGMFRRDASGQVITNEFSGHYYQNWTNEVRKQFKEFMKAQTGQTITHTR